MNLVKISRAGIKLDLQYTFSIKLSNSFKASLALTRYMYIILQCTRFLVFNLFFLSERFCALHGLMRKKDIAIFCV